MAFLERILSEIREDIERPDYDRGVPPRSRSRPPSLRTPLLAHPSPGALVVEFKRVSPGQPTPRLPARSVTEFLAVTELPEVVAYSGLTTRPEFEGSPEDVTRLAAATSRPVLFKDFVVSERQLDVAQRSGASAVLLIARLAGAGAPPVGSEDLVRLSEGAHRRGLEVLLEFHSEAELSLADQLPADAFGVNVRDLDHLTIDRPTAERALARARDQGLRPLVGLSGVESPADAAWFWERGADAILVGSAVARASEPASFLRSLAAAARGVHR
jgi:indole-3-glycerol phosphate synthase